MRAFYSFLSLLKVEIKIFLLSLGIRFLKYNNKRECSKKVKYFNNFITISGIAFTEHV